MDFNSEQLSGLVELSFLGLDFTLIGTGALILIMGTMGLTLDLENFSAIKRAPKAVVVGLFAQVLMLPLVAFLIIAVMSPPIAVIGGLIVIACCPSGATSNFFSYLAKGDVALSIVLTVFSGFIVTMTTPFWINAGFYLFAGEGKEIYLPVIPSMIRIFSLIVVPVVVGMLIKKTFPIFSSRIEPFATKASFAAILLTMAAILSFVANDFVAMMKVGLIPTVMLNFSMMIIGFVGALLLGLGEAKSRTICLEIGVQNYILATVISITLLSRPDFVIVPVLYLFTMYVSTFSFLFYCRKIRDRKITVQSKESLHEHS